MNIHTIRLKYLLWCALAALLIVAGIVGYTYLPTSRGRLCKSVALLECRQYYAVEVNGREVLYFRGLNADTTLASADTVAAEAVTVSYAPACWAVKNVHWPVCRGRLVAYRGTEADSICQMAQRLLPQIVERQQTLLETEEKQLAYKLSSLNDYLRVHGVQDEGFNSVSKYAVRLKRERDSVAHVAARLRRLTSLKKATVTLACTYSIVMATDSGKTQRIACKTASKTDKRGFVLLQTNDKKTPDGVVPQVFHRHLPWHAAEGDVVMAASPSGVGTGSFVPEKAEAQLTAGPVGNGMKHTMPRLLVADGSPVFSSEGHLLGLSWQGQVLSTDQFDTLFK